MLVAIIICCIAMTGMIGYAVYTHEMSYNVPKIDESDPLSIRIKSLKSRILQAQRELEGSEPTVKQIIVNSPPKEQEDINKRNEMSDLRAKLMPKPEPKKKKSLWVQTFKNHDDPILDELEKMQQADKELQDSIKKALNKKNS